MIVRWIASMSLVAALWSIAPSQVAAQDAPAAAATAAVTPEFAPRADAAAEQRAEFRTLDEDVQDLKKQVLDLNRDLLLLEEELLFPSNTQTAVFISMDVGEFFGLDSVELKIDNKDVKLLQRYVSERGKIVPSRITAVSAKKQRELARAIKRARFLALLPYVVK